jgi:nitrite reductase (NADH) large subunit
MPAGHAWGKSYRTCKSCIGTEFCRFGLGDSIGLAQRIERTFRALSDTPGKLKLATAGCPRNCSEALIKDLGAVAIGDGQWEIRVGGAGGSHVRAGDLLCTVAGGDAVMKVAGRFIQFYREDAKYKERTYSWVERVGIERIRAVVVDDCEGWGARFDAGIETAVAAYRDPWAEGSAPRTPHQFASQIVAEATE